MSRTDSGRNRAREGCGNGCGTLMDKRIAEWPRVNNRASPGIFSGADQRSLRRGRIVFHQEATSATSQQERNNWQQGFYPPLDLLKETAACQRLDRATIRLAADIHKASHPPP